MDCRRERRAEVACDECPARLLQVLPENRAAVDLFRRSQRQWEIAPMTGQPLRLDLRGVEVVARAHGQVLDAELLDRLQIMEAERVKVFGERQGRGKDQ